MVWLHHIRQTNTTSTWWARNARYTMKTTNVVCHLITLVKERKKKKWNQTHRHTRTHKIAAQRIKIDSINVDKTNIRRCLDLKTQNSWKISAISKLLFNIKIQVLGCGGVVVVVGSWRAHTNTMLWSVVVCGYLIGYLNLSTVVQHKEIPSSKTISTTLRLLHSWWLLRNAVRLIFV